MAVFFVGLWRVRGDRCVDAFFQPNVGHNVVCRVRDLQGWSPPCIRVSLANIDRRVLWRWTGRRNGQTPNTVAPWGRWDALDTWILHD